MPSTPCSPRSRPSSGLYLASRWYEREQGREMEGLERDVGVVVEGFFLFLFTPWCFRFVSLKPQTPLSHNLDPLPLLQKKKKHKHQHQQVPPHAPLVLVVSGPSGVGKDAAIQALHRARPGLRFVVTATSRARRPGEVDGVDYTFVSKNEFERMIESGELLEHAVVYGEYKGIPKKAVAAALEAARRDVAERDALLKTRAEAAAERALAAAAAGASGSLPSSEEDAAPPPAPPLPLGAGVVVLRIDVQGAATVRRLLPSHSCVSVFLVAESEAALAARLAARGTEEPGALATRVATARSEAARASEFDFVVVNTENDVGGTVEALGAIVDAERCRSSRRLVKKEEETP